MKKERVFWGILFVLLGIFLVISKIGYFNDVNVFSLVLTFFLVVIAVRSLFSLNFPGVLFPAAFICILYDEQLGITALTPWTVLIAALFGSIGLSMIFHKQTKWIKNKNKGADCKFEKIDVEDESNVKFKNSFGACVKYVNTNKFEGARLESSFGAMKIYFDNATMTNENAIVRIEASFSGVELYVPRNWRVIDKTNVFLGDMKEKNKNEQVITNTLTLIGNVNFSGIEIIYI